MDFGGFILFGLCCLALLAGGDYVVRLFAARSPSRKLAVAVFVASAMVVALFGRYLYQVYWLDEPLWVAADTGNTAEVRRLLAAGASPDGAWEDGSTALAAAERSGHTDVVMILRKAGGHTHR